MKRVIATGAIASAAMVALAAAPRQSDQAYRGATNLVSVYVTVTDKTGHLVTDLQQSDFEVRDNGKMQPLTVFSNDRQPFTSVVMLDRSGSMAEHFELVAGGASRFVRELMPEDRVRIGTLGNQIIIRPDAFTGDQNVLLDVIRDQPRELGPSPVWGAIDRSISALMSAEGSRRVVLIFSDGHNNPRRGQSFVDVDDLIRRARSSDVMIYAIGFWEVEPIQARGSSSFPPKAPVQYPFPWGRPSNKPARPATFKLPPGTKGTPPDPQLKELTEETAGGYFELSGTHDLGATFARVAEELHRQYWLGFAPAKLDGKTHRLEVKVKRSGVKVRARETYVAR